MYPDPVLREQSKSVSFPRIGEFDERLSKTVTYMREFMQSLDGVGLAAPQIGILERIIVIDIDNDPIYLINPEIIEKEGECLFEEGCLSVPGTSINIKRPFCVVVKGYDIEGTPQEIRFLISKGTRGKYKKRKGRKLFKMTAAHKEAIRKGIKKSWKRRKRV